MTVGALTRKGFAFAGVMLLAGCASSDDIARYSTPGSGFETVVEVTSRATGKQPVLVQNNAETQAIHSRVSAMVRGKRISADTAVQVALLNNKRLQAVYAEIGIAGAEAWQQTMLPNPRVSLGVFGIGAPDLNTYRSIEGMVASNILAMATMRSRVALADARFRQAQLRAAEETLRLAGETRRAWINAVAAFETVAYLNQAQVTADAASELAERLGESGALPKAGQAREHAFFAELSGQRAQAKLAAELAKEELTRLMGLWGSDINYFVPDALPPLPRKVAHRQAIEREALERRIDLQVAQLELEARAQSQRLTEGMRYVSDIDLLSGFEVEREREEDGTKTILTGQAEIEFVIPIFDSGKARMRKAELSYLQAANLLAERAVNVRSEARAAAKAFSATYKIARHYRNSVLPLRTTIEEEALLTYNGMITNTFELLADTRAKTNAALLAVNSKRDFWLADANLVAAIYGGGAGAGSGGMTASLVEAGGAGH